MSSILSLYKKFLILLANKETLFPTPCTFYSRLEFDSVSTQNAFINKFQQLTNIFFWSYCILTIEIYSVYSKNSFSKCSTGKGQLVKHFSF